MVCCNLAQAKQVVANNVGPIYISPWVMFFVPELSLLQERTLQVIGLAICQVSYLVGAF